MPRVVVPNSVSLHNARAFLQSNDFFADDGQDPVLVLDKRWMHIEPFGLAMLAAWGGWCRRNGQQIAVEGLTERADYAWRMGLFTQLGVDYNPPIRQREEAGRFLPLTSVRTATEARVAIANISALLHLDEDTESLAAVQHCISELLRNVLEHAAAPEGAFVCAHYFHKASIPRVVIAVVDSGRGIAAHLGQRFELARQSDTEALLMAMRPGITGAIPGIYGTPDNAGAGLFITRSISKGCGGYFLLASGNAAYRLKRSNNPDAQTTLFPDPLNESHDLWALDHNWRGTIVSLEIRTDTIPDFHNYMGWIRDAIPARMHAKKRIRFT